MMAAPQSRGAEGPPISDVFLTYIAYGFSVIPLAPGTKKPHAFVLPKGKWGAYQERIARPDEVETWVNTSAPGLGVGIVCGQISGSLYCLDVDDVEFATYLEGLLQPRDWLGLWVVRTGSDKLHLWVRSRETVYTTNLVGAGRKLADIRGDGNPQLKHGPSYMVAPPSTHPDTGKEYRTLAGSPEFMPTIDNAAAMFNVLRDNFLGNVAITRAVSADTPEQDIDSGDHTILPHDDNKRAEVESWLATAQLSRKVRKAILEGATYGEGMWSGAPSNSEIDNRIITELRENSWSIAQIEQTFAWSPVGQNCYANKARGNHGRGYLTFSITKIDKRIAEAKQAGEQASGDNFIVTSVVRIGYEDPLYECVVHATATDTKGVVHLRVEQLMDEHQFKKQVMREMNFLPLVPKSLAGRKFEKLGNMIARMAGMEAVPQVATTAGHLRGVTLAVINREIDPHEPDDERMMRVGWRNGTNAYFRGIAVLQHLQAVLRPAPKPESVWAVLRAMGGEEEGWRWTSGRKEALWVLPMGRLEE